MVQMTNRDHLHIHIHISKTAGTSIKNLLLRNYPTGEFLDRMIQGREMEGGYPKTVDSNTADVLDVVSTVGARETHLSCVSVNLPYGLHRILTRPVQYFAVLRDPLQRFVSRYHFIHRVHSATLSTEPNKFDPSRAVRINPFSKVGFLNDQVRMLTGCASREISEREFDLARELIDSGAILAMAFENLENSIAQCGAVLNWSDIQLPRLNIAPQRRVTIPPEIADRILSVNQWDFALHQWVTERLV